MENCEVCNTKVKIRPVFCSSHTDYKLCEGCTAWGPTSMYIPVADEQAGLLWFCPDCLEELDDE